MTQLTKQYSCVQILEKTKEYNELYLGDIQSAMNKSTLSQHNIKAILTAAPNLYLSYFKSGIKHSVLPAIDSKDYNIQKSFSSCNDFIDKNLKQGAVLVHCVAGVSRSATVVIAYLMERFRWTFEQGLRFVKLKKPNIKPNDGFIEQLREYQQSQNIIRPKQRSHSRFRSIYAQFYQQRFGNITPLQKTISQPKLEDYQYDSDEERKSPFNQTQINFTNSMKVSPFRINDINLKHIFQSIDQAFNPYKTQQSFQSRFPTLVDTTTITNTKTQKFQLYNQIQGNRKIPEKYKIRISNFEEKNA